MEKTSQQHPAHVGLATFAIALMALGLAAGMEVFGVVDRLNRLFASLMQPSGLSMPEQSLDPVLLWVVAALWVVGLTAVMLNLAGVWRRLLVWGLSLIMAVFWAPVLLLAAHQPEIGVVIVGLLWSGCCAMVYTSNHEMPADSAAPNLIQDNDGTR